MFYFVFQTCFSFEIPLRKLSTICARSLTSQSPDRSHQEWEDLSAVTIGLCSSSGHTQGFNTNPQSSLWPRTEIFFFLANVDLFRTSCSWRSSDSTSPRGWWLASGTATKHGGLWASQRSRESGHGAFGGSLEAPRAAARKESSLWTTHRAVLQGYLRGRDWLAVCGRGVAAAEEAAPPSRLRGPWIIRLDSKSLHQAAYKFSPRLVKVEKPPFSHTKVRRGKSFMYTSRR